MLTYSYDVFENETEVSKLISNLQSEGKKYMRIPDALDFPVKKEFVSDTIRK